MASLWVFPSSVGFVGRNEVGVLHSLTRGYKRQTSGTDSKVKRGIAVGLVFVYTCSSVKVEMFQQFLE